MEPTQHTQPTVTRLHYALHYPDGGWYIAAARAFHEQHCANCRTHTEAANALAAASAASTARVDRLTLGLRLTARREAPRG